MGQYHQIVNLTARSCLTPREFGSGAKLMEFGHDHGAAMGALILLLSAEAWGGARIAILGDYGEPNDLPAEVIAETGIDGSGYGHPTLTDASADAIALIQRRGLSHYDTTSWRPRLIPTDPSPRSGREIVIWNLDRDQYLDPLSFGNATRDLHDVAQTGGLGGPTTALAVLLAAASRDGGRGGGDFHRPSSWVGAWAGDRLVVCPTTALPTTAVDVSQPLRETLALAGEGSYDVSPDGTVQRCDPWAQPFAPAVGA